MFCVLGCIIGILDWAVSFINRYAFCHIALYGKAYIPAAKDTWHMMRDRGIDALVNDCLTGPVITMGSLVSDPRNFSLTLKVPFSQDGFH